MELPGELPFGTELPGTIRFFEDKNEEDVAEFETLVRLGCTEATDVLNPTLRLGLNMYSKETAAGTSSAAQAKTVSMSQAAALKAFSSSPGDKSGQGRKQLRCRVNLIATHLPNALYTYLSQDNKGSLASPDSRNPHGITASSAKAELTMLADLLGE